MKPGYIALHRKLQDNFLWKERRVFSKAEAWIDILMEARWQIHPEKVILGNKIIECNYAECLKSLETWARRWNWNKSKVRRTLELFQKNNMIVYKNEIVTLRITVCNYAQYDPKQESFNHEQHLIENRHGVRSKTDTEMVRLNECNDSEFEESRNANETQMKRKRNANETHSTPEEEVKNIKKENTLVSLDDDFALFWDAYPPRGVPPRRTSKNDAFKTYRKVSKAKNFPSISRIIELVEAEKKTQQWRNPQYIPLASTWLNRQTWADDNQDETPKSGSTLLDLYSNGQLEMKPYAS